MTRKILDQGPQEYTLKCRHCGCTFSYELDDVVLTYGVSAVVYCARCQKALPHKDQSGAAKGL